MSARQEAVEQKKGANGHANGNGSAANNNNNNGGNEVEDDPTWDLIHGDRVNFKQVKLKESNWSRSYRDILV